MIELLRLKHDEHALFIGGALLKCAPSYLGRHPVDDVSSLIGDAAY
ncbi:hypothetical protein PTUN_a0393 [Pseudoalteromonas tunicata]|nr:hypothetical protein PTUN_a0393 [Pseudoalteromonas tunicata]